MALVELGPVTSRLVQTVGQTVDRMRPRNPHKIAFEVLDRTGGPVFYPADDTPVAVNAPLKPTERADFDDLKRLRGALYSGTED